MTPNYRLYTITRDCEKELLSIPSGNAARFHMLHKQGLSSDFLESVSKKLAEVLGVLPEITSKMLHSMFCTFGWVRMRMARVQDWWDIHSILDYVTRVHFGKPCATLIFDLAFDVDEQAAAQSMDWSVVKDLLSGYKALKTHPVVIKFLKVVSLAFSGGILATLGIEGQVAELWKIISESMTKILGHTDFVSAVLDLCYFVGERISAFCVTGSWKSLLHTPTSYTKWADASFDCLDKSAALANPDAVGLDYHVYTKNLCDLIAQGEEIKRYVRAADEKDAVSQLLSRLRVLYNDILIRNACGKFRMSPFSIMLSAGSGVGKSSFVETLIAHYGKVYNKPLGEEFIYTRTASEAHWNNFKTSMWACILDDVAFINPNKGTEDPSLSDILQVVNNVPFSPPQASLEDKGRTPFKCELVVATTNTEDLKAHNWFNNPQAIRRRLPYVVNLIPKVQYRQPGSEMLDTTKVPTTMPGYYTDLWEIVVKKVCVEPNQDVVMEEILRTESIYEFIIHYNTWVEDHRQNQAAFMASKQITQEVELCLIHKLPVRVCPCPDNDMALAVQAGEEDLSTQGAILSTSNPVLTAAVAYATYKTVKFTADCAGEVITAKPDIIQTPALLALATTGRMYQKTKWALDKKVQDFTREGVKAILKAAVYGVYEQYKPYLKVVMLSLATIAGVGITWKLLQKEFPEFADQFIQVNIDEVGVAPEKGTEKENVWRKDDYVPSEFVGRLGQSWNALPFTKACSLLAKNTVWCKTTHGVGRHMTFRATCVYGHLYVVPNHVLPYDEYFTLQVIHDNTAEGCNGNISFKVAQNCIYRCPRKELAFFEINHMPVRRNIVELFPKAGFRCDGPGRIIVRQANASVEYVSTRRTVSLPGTPVEQFNLVLDVSQSFTERDTVDGECGSIVVVENPAGCIIAGIHVLGGQHCQAVSVHVTQDDIELAKNHFDIIPTETEVPFLEGQNFTTDISPRCTARFIPEGTVEVFGSFNTFKRQPKSTARDTLFTQALLARGHVRKFGPAPMKGYSAVHIGLKSMVQKTMTFKEDVMNLCAEAYTTEVWNGLSNKYKRELKNILPLKVALNGMPGVKFIDSMNFGTSAGYPHNKTKRKYVMRVPADDVWQHPIEVDSQIKKEINDCWDAMCQGISTAPVFMEHLKDEALPLRKVKAGKARLFMGGPFAWSTCVRMALLPFIRVMQLNKYLFECAPGTNATSIEWTRLYQYLTKHGKLRMIAGDFEAFDKLMGALVILLAFRVIRNILRLAGASDEHLRAVQVIAEDIAFAFTNFNGDLMRFFGSNPSGHPLTVIINCIVNSLYMRYCYHELNPEHEVMSFKKFVALITYGDDNAMGSAVDWFNHTAISAVLKTVGINYTMADKLAESVPFIPIEEVSFLKRSFTWNDELRAYMATLDTESIWKSLMIFVPSKTDCPQKQCLDIVRSAVSEWFFYGRERFEKECALLKELVHEVGLDIYVESNTFSTWEELSERFISCSNDYLDTEPVSSLELVGPCVWSLRNKSVD